MSITSVALLGAKYPEQMKEINRISAKWEKRTKDMTSPWPREGTFDTSVCDDMERRIADYKPKDKSKKRQGKRERELQYYTPTV